MHLMENLVRVIGLYNIGTCLICSQMHLLWLVCHILIIIFAVYLMCSTYQASLKQYMLLNFEQIQCLAK